MSAALRQTPIEERVRQLHERLTAGDVEIRRPTGEPRRRTDPLVPSELRQTFESYIHAGETREAIGARFGVTPEQVVKYAYKHHLPVPPSAAVYGPIIGERIPIPQRAPAGPGPLPLAGSVVAPSAPPDAPGGPRSASERREAVKVVPEPTNATAVTSEALEGIEWIRPGRGHAERRTTVTVTEQSWYFSNAAAALIGSPERVRVGRTPTGVVVVAPGTDADPDSLRLIHKGKEGAGASLRAKCLAGLLAPGVYAVRCERGWLVAEGEGGKG